MRDDEENGLVEASHQDMATALDAIATSLNCENTLDDMLHAIDKLAEAKARALQLDQLVNNPQTAAFLEAVRSEVAHQIERWGTVGDRAKEPADWFWLVGYLAGKALAAHAAGNKEKALHHTVSTSAALANWWAHIQLGSGAMTPGASDLQAYLEEAFGQALEPA